MKAFRYLFPVMGILGLASSSFGDVVSTDDPVLNPLVLIRSSEVFVPNGFDDNDEVVAVLDGYLPDTCYKIAFNNVLFDSNTKTYTVQQFARRFSQLCIMLEVPFTTEVSLGVVNRGSFKIAASGAEPGTLEVKAANTASADDYVYAPIDEARVEKSADQSAYIATISGRFTNTCMQFDDLRLIDSGKTLELLPIISMRSGSNCEAKEISFSKKVDLPQRLSEGRHLLHVRSLNGKAVNTVFSVGPVRLAP